MLVLTKILVLTLVIVSVVTMTFLLKILAIGSNTCSKDTSYFDASYSNATPIDISYSVTCNN